MTVRLEVGCDDLKRSPSNGLRVILVGSSFDILENIFERSGGSRGVVVRDQVLELGGRGWGRGSRPYVYGLRAANAAYVTRRSRKCFPAVF